MEQSTLVLQLHQDVKPESICPDTFIPYSAVNKINNVLIPGIIPSPSLVGILLDSVKKQCLEPHNLLFKIHLQNTDL